MQLNELEQALEIVDNNENVNKYTSLFCSYCDSTEAFGLFYIKTSVRTYLRSWCYRCYNRQTNFNRTTCIKLNEKEIFTLRILLENGPN